MADVNSILNQRMKKPSNVSKMAAMAKQSAAGDLTTFSGLFSVSELSQKEKDLLEGILTSYANDNQEIRSDLASLISITSEVKAINNQAALLHGERIKKAHQILIRYRDGAFTSWLIAAYGNRQTPYNLMQYYEFCEAMPKPLRQQIEMMPRQAIYVLASREGSMEKKRAIVESYKGETKDEMLELIRKAFPLQHNDKRQRKIGSYVIQGLQRIYDQLHEAPPNLTPSQKKQAKLLLKHIDQLIGAS